MSTYEFLFLMCRFLILNPFEFYWTVLIVSLHVDYPRKWMTNFLRSLLLNVKWRSRHVMEEKVDFLWKKKNAQFNHSFEEYFLPFGADGSISVSLISIWVLVVSSTAMALSVSRWYCTFSLWAVRLTKIFTWREYVMRENFRISPLTSFLVRYRPARRRISSRSFSRRYPQRFRSKNVNASNNSGWIVRWRVWTTFVEDVLGSSVSSGTGFFRWEDKSS